MQLRTKLVLAATSATLVLVLILSAMFLAELLREHIAQTTAGNEVIARQVLLMVRQAVEAGLRAQPPKDGSKEALHQAISGALEGFPALADTMNGFVRYSSAIQDISVSDADARILASTDPQLRNQTLSTRVTSEGLRDSTLPSQLRQIFGPAHLLDQSVTLERNGKPFLVVHVGVQSTFLKDNYAPFLRDAFLIILIAALASVVASAFLASLVLKPLEDISNRLEIITGIPEKSLHKPGPPRRTPNTDAVIRVTENIERLGQQIRTAEAGYTDLQASLNHVLEALREGVVLFTAERRAAMISDSVANFMGRPVGIHDSMVGSTLEQLFGADTALGRAVLDLFQVRGEESRKLVRMEDGREIEVKLDRIDDVRGRRELGTLLRLHDMGSAMQLEQELEVSRRLAAVGKLTAGVGHEVKNPINAMVVHLELLRSKLESAAGESFLVGAMPHVEILAGEMKRLDRVVQTLADFTRPMELHLEEVRLDEVVESVLELTGLELAENLIEVRCDLQPVDVRGDGAMLRQAMLNLVLNGMQAMVHGGTLKVLVGAEQDVAVLRVIDDGIGIPADLLSRVFDLYFTTKAEGSGIGLSMTYRIIQMHGGSMEVVSELGSGATFVIKLPLIAADMRSRQIAVENLS